MRRKHSRGFMNHVTSSARAHPMTAQLAKGANPTGIRSDHARTILTVGESDGMPA